MSVVSSVSASDQVRAAFDFSVDKFPLSGPDGMRTPWYAMFRSDTGQPIGEGSVTKRYEPHQTEDVVALVEACESVFEKSANVKTHFRNGHYVTVSPSNEFRRSIYGTNDNIFPRLIIRGGYDKSALHVVLGTYRDACDNLQMMTSVDQVCQRIRHTSGLREKMSELVSQFQSLKDGWDNIADTVHRMQSSEVQFADFLNAVYPQPTEESGQRAISIHRNRTEAIFQRLVRERQHTGRPSLDSAFTVSAWEAYNAVQGHEQHIAPRREGFRGQFDRILQAAKSQHVRKAEELAISAAA